LNSAGSGDGGAAYRRVTREHGLFDRNESS
jgi:hypothetical protein